MEWAKENQRKNQRDQQIICTIPSVPRATLQGPAHPCRHNGHGGPLESLKVRLTLPLAPAEDGPTHTGRFAERRARADLRMMSWSALGRFTYPGTPQSTSSHFVTMQACVSRYASCEERKTECHNGRRRQKISATSEYAGDAPYILLVVRSSISSATRVLFLVDLPIDTHLLFHGSILNPKSTLLAACTSRENKAFVHTAGEGVPLFHCIRQARFASTATTPPLPESVQDVTSILYNFCLVMRRVPPRPHLLRVSNRKSNNGITHPNVSTSATP